MALVAKIPHVLEKQYSHPQSEKIAYMAIVTPLLVLILNQNYKCIKIEQNDSATSYVYQVNPFAAFSN